MNFECVIALKFSMEEIGNILFKNSSTEMEISPKLMLKNA